eukprot:TRINITY_DN796_c0_g1_i2.p1 TRINITY_DN796_c0_g1~~TRINITY_DN796_c0_g1_i2.p1  ORF type:complete len:818 (-),score=164.66 TRINITY_DN796_c0_g1_i2:46-2499(-)
MWNYGKRERKHNRVPHMDPFAPQFKDAIMGVPLGGIGCGTIGRGWRGDFLRWTLLPAAIPSINVVEVDQFSVFSRNSGDHSNANASVLYTPAKKSVHAPKTSPVRSAWDFGLKGDKSTYHALFPQAWTIYDGETDADLKITCHQVSPVIPHDYENSSFPASVFEFTIENRSTVHDKDVSLMFSFQNGMGAASDSKGGHSNHFFQEKSDNFTTTGIKLTHAYEQMVFEDWDKNNRKYFSDPLSFAIATNADPSKVSYTTQFASDDVSVLKSVWNKFKTDGKLDNSTTETKSVEGKTIAGAISVSERVGKGQSVKITFTLTWDTPIARFSSGKAYYRRYTKFYGTSGDAVQKIASDALKNYPNWIKAINQWQDTILSNEKLSKEYKMALFNELYYLVDGGTIWTHGRPDQSAQELKELESADNFGNFFYLEGHEYLMCNTYDVHFYASFALISLWPELQLALQREIARATVRQMDVDWFILHDGSTVKRLVRWAVPHDVGNPGEDPWVRPNSYNIQQIQRWKDLNCKFVLQVYRDYVATNNKEFLESLWPIVKKAVEYSFQFDKDGDGMIENEGFPDQTYDTWSATGVSAYCGGLWVATLKVARSIAHELLDVDAFEDYDKKYQIARDVYIKKLWNGTYFNYDTSKNVHRDSIQADMMAGNWYAVSCGVGGIVPIGHAKSSLETVYRYNVAKFVNGTRGAVNGMRPNGAVDEMCMQSKEVWTGTTYAVAAAMLQVGLEDEAFKTMKGVIDTTYTTHGYMFQTPEAWLANGSFRSCSYMRPLSVWAVQWAYDNAQKQLATDEFDQELEAKMKANIQAVKK